MKNPDLQRRAVMAGDPNEHEEKVAEAARFARRMTGKARNDAPEDAGIKPVDVRAAQRVRDPGVPGV